VDAGFAEVIEPTSLLAMASGMSGLMFARRRRRRRASGAAS
jgi:hypothetical protein